MRIDVTTTLFFDASCLIAAAGSPTGGSGFLLTLCGRALSSMTPDQVAEVTRAIERVIAALDPQQIYVFGSHARGDATSDSDVDLLVVVPDSEVPAHRRAQAAYDAVGPHLLPLDILVMPRSEFDRRCRAASSLPATVLREGSLLYAA